APGPAVSKQLGRALVGDRRHVVALEQARVRLAIGDVGPESAVLDHHRLARGRVVAQLTQRRRRSALPATAFGFGVDLQRLVQGDVEYLILGRQRARIGAALQIWAVAAVLRGDLLVRLRID